MRVSSGRYFLTHGRADLLWSVSIALAQLGGSAVNGVLLARLLGPHERGVLAGAMLVPSLAIVIGGVPGVKAAIVYHVAKSGRSQHGDLVRVVAVAAVCQALVLVFAGLAGMHIVFRGDAETISAGRQYLSVIPLGMLATYGIGALQGIGKIRLSAAIQALIPFGYLVATLILVALDLLSVRSAIYANIALNALASMLASYFLWASALLQRPPSANRFGHLLASICRYGLRASFGEASQALNLRVDQVIIAALLSTKELGIYVAAASVAAPLRGLGQAFRLVFLPRSAQIIPSSAEWHRLRGRLTLSYAMVAVTLLIPSVLLAPILIPRLLGSAYAQSASIAMILLGAASILGYKDALGSMLAGSNRPGALSLSELVGLAVTVVSLALLLPSLRLHGAAISSLLSYTTSCALVVVLVRRDGERAGMLSDRAGQLR